MRVFMTRWMARFARRSKISDAQLLDAIDRIERGLIDADLGGGVIKQRVGRDGEGRSGGYRTLIAIRIGERAVFVYAFAKKDRANIGPDELQTLRDLARDLLALGADGLERALAEGRLQEIDDA